MGWVKTDPAKEITVTHHDEWVPVDLDDWSADDVAEQSDERRRVARMRRPDRRVEDAPQVTITEEEAEELGARIQGVAARQAIVEHELIRLVGELDASGGVAWFQGITSTAHWLSWACSMTAGPARERVRVARALRSMPTTDRLFGEGRLTYSKVRELTRLVGQMDEEKLCELALNMTASQLARTVGAYRRVPGNRKRAEDRTRLTWRDNHDGSCTLSVTLPTEEAARLRTALDAATEKVEPNESIDEPIEQSYLRTQVDALLELADHYLDDHADHDRDDDNHLVVVQVSAESLAGEIPENVPAGTSHIPGVGAVEGATAARLACTGRIVGALVDRHGDVLHLGRTRRNASRAQRRAMRVRDGGVCQYPGCTRTRRLIPHHIVSWAFGGKTDLENLVSLCHHHHVCVHEGGITVHREGSGWVFRHPDGRPVRAPGDPWVPTPLRNDDIEPADASVFPQHAGEGFQLAECVRVLFDLRLEDFRPAA